MKLPAAQLRSPKLQDGDPIRSLARKLSKISKLKPSRSPSQPPAKAKVETATLPQNPEPEAVTRSAPATKLPSVTLPKLKAPTSKGARLAFNLLLVRPWILVLGFWLISLVSASVAWEGMISPRKLKMALPEAVPETAATAQKGSFVKVEAPEETSAETQSQAAESSSKAKGASTKPVDAAAVAGAANKSGGVPVLPLTLLVGGCAAGCLAISRRRAMMRLSTARSRVRSRKVRPVAVPVAIANQPGQPARMATPASPRQGGVRQGTERQPGKKVVRRKLVKSSPIAAANPFRTKKRRQRRKSAQSQPGAKATKRVMISRSDAQKSISQKPVPQKPGATKRGGQKPAVARAANGRRRAQRVPQRRVASRRQPVVSVVPAGQSHPLDWTNGSLAHQLDVRQRSAM